MKILIAEDDLICSRILENNLKNWGYETVLAKSGEKAWDALKDTQLRLAILDWMMPGMAGVEICKKVRRRKKHNYTYIILLSAKDRKQDIIAGLSSGADDYMTKPVNFLELRARLQTGKRIIDLEDKLLHAQNQLKDLASRDSLTRLWNRAEIAKFLSEEIERSQREKKPLAVLMLDLDDFKRVNDFYGHDIGDMALLQIVSRLKKRVRKSDKVGRYGGDEIIIILPSCNTAEVKKIAERLRSAIACRAIKTAVDRIPLTISAGCVSSEKLEQPTAEKLIRAADSALLKAKNFGRNCVVIDEPAAPSSEERKK